jgi:hypothetical protein
MAACGIPSLAAMEGGATLVIDRTLICCQLPKINAVINNPKILLNDVDE